MRGRRMRFLVVGGGITGSVAATALAQRGAEVDLAEIVPEWTGTGHGITLQGNALRAFKVIGVWASVRERGFPFDRVRLSRADGSLIVEAATPRTGGPDLPATMGAVRSALPEILAAPGYAAGRLADRRGRHAAYRRGGPAGHDGRDAVRPAGDPVRRGVRGRRPGPARADHRGLVIGCRRRGRDVHRRQHGAL